MAKTPKNPQKPTTTDPKAPVRTVTAVCPTCAQRNAVTYPDKVTSVDIDCAKCGKRLRCVDTMQPSQRGGYAQVIELIR